MSNPLNGGGFSVGVGTMQGYTSIQIFTGFETCDSLWINFELEKYYGKKVMFKITLLR